MHARDTGLRGDSTVGEGVGHCVKCKVAESFRKMFFQKF